MSLDDVTDWTSDLPVGAVAAIGAVAAFLVVLAVGAQLSARRLRQELARAEEELVDPATGLLPRSALRVRLGAEIAWAATSRTPIAVAVLRIRGSRFRHATSVLRAAMREEESAFTLGDDRVAVELWDADPDAAAAATRRLGEDLRRAGHPVVDAGIGCSPRDGSDVETLVAAGQRDLRPVDDPLEPGHDIGGDGRARSGAARATRLLGGIAPWLVMASALALVAWRLVPAAVQPALVGDGSRSASQVAYAIVATVGLPLGAALVLLAGWNAAVGSAPRSRPLARAGWLTALAAIVAVAAPLSWSVLHPERVGEVSAGFGATLAVLALVLLVLVHARQLLHLPIAVLVALALAGGAVTWAAVEPWSVPVLADAGRLLLAAAFGALLARQVERASWMVALAVLAAAVDLWSVLADSGVSNHLLERSARGDDDRLVDLVLFTGPTVDGANLFAVGTVDLVFLALFLAWSHDWRLDLRVVVGALLAATWGGMLVAELTDEAVPLLPFLGAAMVVVLAVRSVVLRRRGRAWRRRGGSAASSG
ncbi:MAG: hypothetical protein JWM98_2965 [Thermoleophilia bacterium]|nr:hypothetical protein [Thermoleophilia bacterium]